MTIKARPRIIPYFLTVIGLTGLLTIAACTEPDNAQALLGLVKENMKRAEYGAASLELANLIQSHPNHLEARLLQGKVSLAAGRAGSSEAQLKFARDLGAPGRLLYQPMAQAILAQGQPERIASALGNRPEEVGDLLAWLTARGTAALHTHQIGEAEEHFTEVMRLDKDSLDGRLGLASVQRARGNLDAASVYLENATRNSPLSIAAWQALGALRYEEGRLVDAERAFINAIEGVDGIDRGYEYMLARVGLIESQWHLDKKSLAIQNTKELMDSYPWHPLPKYVRGLLSFLEGEYSSAGDHLYRVIAILPNHQPTLKLLSAINSTQGKLGRAQLYLEKYFALNDSDPDMIVLLAETYLKMGNADESVATMRPLITPSTENASYLDLYGTACRYAQSCKDGHVYLARAVRADPDNLRRQTRLAAAYLNRSDLVSADALMSTWNPPGRITETSRQVLRLERFLRSGQHERAIEYAKKLRRENPANLHALLALAEVAYVRGEIEVESAWLELARERNPSAVEPRLILANQHMLKQRYHQAVIVAQEAAAAHPYNASILRILAHALINIQQYDEALSTASEAKRLAPTREANILMLIHAYLINNNKLKARALAKELLDQNPSSTRDFAPMVLEIHKQGHERLAHETLKILTPLSEEQDVIAEIEGDLFFIEEENELAASAYAKANSIKPSKLRLLKARLMQASSGNKTSNVLR